MMTADELRRFIEGRTVRALDPETGAGVATVAYRPDGSCRLRHLAGGAVEDGRYGFDGPVYWTRYAAFRGGEVNRFTLTAVRPGRAQAWHDDGRRAYLLVDEGGVRE
ncbi:MAG: hypothetical protein RLO51_14915 [Thalassobaculum sp.]|uniref:hypothetical protein n=1 Tax=Thalassobaculum sp. TaxID=2022740 RepID=UPI0032EFDF8A